MWDWTEARPMLTVLDCLFGTTPYHELRDFLSDLCIKRHSPVVNSFRFDHICLHIACFLILPVCVKYSIATHVQSLPSVHSFLCLDWPGQQ